MNSGEIKDACQRSDVVIVSLHSHQFNNNDNALPAEFCEIFCRKCVEAGANIVFCHGPHRLRGVEIYKKSVILHGLGNFVFQNEDVDILPEDLYNRYKTSRQERTGVADLFNIRSANGSRGLWMKSETCESLIASVTISDKCLSIKLHPIELINGSLRGLRGLPTITKNMTAIRDVKILSEKYSTKIAEENNYGVIKIDR